MLRISPLKTCHCISIFYEMLGFFNIYLLIAKIILSSLIKTMLGGIKIMLSGVIGIMLRQLSGVIKSKLGDVDGGDGEIMRWHQNYACLRR